MLIYSGVSAKGPFANGLCGHTPLTAIYCGPIKCCDQWHSFSLATQRAASPSEGKLVYVHSHLIITHYMNWEFPSHSVLKQTWTTSLTRQGSRHQSSSSSSSLSPAPSPLLPRARAPWRRSHSSWNFTSSSVTVGRTCTLQHP